MKASLQAKMGQSMTLTPQLLQSIRLLQVTSLQLEQELQLVLERNPLLEQEPEEEDLHPDGEGDDAALEAAAWDELPEPMFLSGGSYTGDPDEDATARIAAGESSDPRQRLLQQLQLRCTAQRPGHGRLVAGLLRRPRLSGSAIRRNWPARAPRNCRMPCPASMTKASLAVRQRLLLDGDWPGMAAADPRECLLAQLRALPASDARVLALRIVDDQLEALARHDLPGLAGRLRASAADVAAAVSPGAVAAAAPGGTAAGAGTRLHRAGRDRLACRRRLAGAPEHPQRRRACASARTRNRPPGTRGMRGLLDEARWLLRGLGIRNETLLKTARVLVERQQAFLERGEEAIAPLTLKEVAEEIGVHESTVSRITTGKYIQTPRGTLELKRLFAVRLEGAEVSGAAIKAMVRRLIEDEPAHAPLADEVIAAPAGPPGRARRAAHRGQVPRTAVDRAGADAPPGGSSQPRWRGWADLLQGKKMRRRSGCCWSTTTRASSTR